VGVGAETLADEQEVGRRWRETQRLQEWLSRERRLVEEWERRSGGREEKRRVTTISRVRKFEVEYRNIFQRVEKVKTETTVSVQKYS